MGCSVIEVSLTASQHLNMRFNSAFQKILKYLHIKNVSSKLEKCLPKWLHHSFHISSRKGCTSLLLRYVIKCGNFSLFFCILTITIDTHCSYCCFVTTISFKKHVQNIFFFRVLIFSPQSMHEMKFNALLFTSHTSVVFSTLGAVIYFKRLDFFVISYYYHLILSLFFNFIRRQSLKCGLYTPFKLSFVFKGRLKCRCWVCLLSFLFLLLLSFYDEVLWALGFPHPIP